MELNHEELAWAAGFFDGEGYIGITNTNKGKHKRLNVQLAQIYIEPLERFQKAVGHGKIYGPYRRNTPNRQEYWLISFTYLEETQAVIALLWKWLSPPKRAQASKALKDFQDYRKTLTYPKKGIRK